MTDHPPDCDRCRLADVCGSFGSQAATPKPESSRCPVDYGQVPWLRLLWTRLQCSVLLCLAKISSRTLPPAVSEQVSHVVFRFLSLSVVVGPVLSAQPSLWLSSECKKTDSVPGPQVSSRFAQRISGTFTWKTRAQSTNGPWRSPTTLWRFLGRPSVVESVS